MLQRLVGSGALSGAVKQAVQVRAAETPAKRGAKKYANDENALVNAACAGDAGVVERILLAGVDADARAQGEPVLHIAAADGLLDVVRRLVKLGATVDLADETGRTALHAAAMNNHLPVVAYLISSGAEVDRGDGDMRTALHHASMRGLRTLCTYLLEKGADPKRRDAEGMTAVELMNNSAFLPEVLNNINGVLVSEVQQRQLFDRLDTGRSGTLPLGRVQELLAELDPIGVQQRAAPVESVLQEVDGRGDGRVTFDEFARIMLRIAAL
eukprot:TRINITY_DN71194_c0_g1_i1.p1 TRINITY_DN71194_c0_g1~~TRINITY_DN71194_c0_g1_i1.p1  ORF type:complete len:292 (+),score=109.63 TRINITY_DN71194_c0_g1_i1:72-878(+)